MAKYRLLSEAELQSLEKEFIQFLVINGIVAKDWEMIKEKQPDKADQIIELFSDVVYEQSLRETKFLRVIHKKSISCFQCLSNEIILMGLRFENELNEVPKSLPKFLDQYAGQLEVFSSKKKYTLSREKELFDLIEGGAKISDGQFFKQISLAYAKNRS